MDDLDKKYYRISEVAEILNIPASTLRFWESKFTIIKPHRNAGNTRLYTPKDIEKIRMIYFLVKDKGLKLDAAQEQIRNNASGVSRQRQVLERLRQVRDKLAQLQATLGKMR